MPFCDWENDDWETLNLALQHKNCILMLGPDIPMENNEKLEDSATCMREKTGTAWHLVPRE